MKSFYRQRILSPFLDVTRMSYVTSFFLRMARLWNSLLTECFLLNYDLFGFKSRINRHLLTVCRFFLKRSHVCFNLFVLLFLVTPCLVAAVPCMEWIPIKKLKQQVQQVKDQQSCIFVFVACLTILSSN